MNIFYVYAHPNPGSLNNLLKQTGIRTLEEAKNNVIVSDLYAEQFNPVASWNDFNVTSAELNSQYFISQKMAYDKNVLADDIKAEIEKLAWANHIILQFPMWWFSVPAILKGWLDRILVKGFAYDTGKIFSNGLLKGKSASLVVTTQSSEADYQSTGIHGCMMDTFLLPIHHTLRFVGMEIREPFIIHSAFNINEHEQVNILARYQHYLQKIL